MSYTVRSCFCARTDNHSRTSHYSGSAVFKAPIWATQFAVASALVQTTTHQPATIVVLLYLKLPFELRSSQLLLRSYRQPLTNQALPARHNRMLHQPAVIKVSLGADSSSLKVAGLLTVVQNTASAQLCVWITQAPQVSYQHRALYKLFKIYWWITCGKKFNKYSKIYIFQHSFPVIPLLTEKDS